MSEPLHRVEYIEVSYPSAPWWRPSFKSNRYETQELLSRAISEKCNELASQGWVLARVQLVSRSDIDSKNHSAVWLHLTQSREKTVISSSNNDDQHPNLKERLESGFATVYMTFTSIIQGVALAVLAQQTFGYIVDTGVSNFSEWASIIPYALVSFMFIITVAFDYSTLIGIYRWTLRLSDVFFPFSLGLTQIGAAYFLSTPKAWWALNGVLAAIGVLAFFHTYWRTRSEMGDLSEIVEDTKRDVFLSLSVASLVVILCSAMAFLYLPGSKIGVWNVGDIVPTSAYFVLLAGMLWSQDRSVSQGLIGRAR